MADVNSPSSSHSSATAVELHTQRVCANCNCSNLYDVIVQNVDGVSGEDQTVIATVATEAQTECPEHGERIKSATVMTTTSNIQDVDVEAEPISGSAATNAILASAITDDSFFHWNKGTIKLLINHYRENMELFYSPNVKKRKAWEVIAHTIREKGIHVTGQQCESKWKNLQRNYRRIKNDVMHLGCTTSRWPYMAEMEEILSMRPTEEGDDCEASQEMTDANESTTQVGLQQVGNQINSNGLDASRKRKLDEEPIWFKTYRNEVHRRHEQRMALQRQLMEQHKLLARQLIKVLESFKK